MATDPATQSALNSLASAADAARKAYMAANAANPTADLGQLYRQEMQAQALAADALDKQLASNPGVQAAQTALDQASAGIRNNLATFTNITTALTTMTNLVKLATTLRAFFV